MRKTSSNIYRQAITYFQLWNRLLPVLVLCLVMSKASAVVKIKGHILNMTDDTVRISYNDNRLAYYPKEFAAQLDKNGSFSLEVPVPASGYILTELKYDNHVAELVLADNDSVLVAADVSRFDSSIHYSGRGGNVQNFVAKHTTDRGRLNQYTVKLRNHIAEGPQDFLKSIENERKDEMAYLDKYKGGLPASFVKFWSAHYTYYNYFFIEQYPQMHEMQKVRHYTDTIPEENYTIVRALPNAFDDEYLQVPSYLLYLTGVFETKLRAAGYGVPVTDSANARMLLDSVDVLAYKVLPSKSAEYFIAQSLYARARVQYLDRSRAVFSKFKKRWPNSEYLPLLYKQMELAEKLSAGQPAPDFDVAMADGKVVKLSSLKGKVVFLSFWASWCKQCVGELRMLERKVKVLMANKPVEFVYVSIDEDTAVAKLMQQQMGLTGNFTTTNGGWYAPEAQLYGLQGLPAYFLIDKEGNFAVSRPPSPQQSLELMIAISKLSDQ